jgi:hypothetical protein
MWHVLGKCKVHLGYGVVTCREEALGADRIMYSGQSSNRMGGDEHYLGQVRASGEFSQHRGTQCETFLD